MQPKLNDESFILLKFGGNINEEIRRKGDPDIYAYPQYISYSKDRQEIYSDSVQQVTERKYLELTDSNVGGTFKVRKNSLILKQFSPLIDEYRIKQVFAIYGNEDYSYLGFNKDFEGYNVHFFEPNSSATRFAQYSSSLKVEKYKGLEKKDFVIHFDMSSGLYHYVPTKVVEITANGFYRTRQSSRYGTRTYYRVDSDSFLPVDQILENQEVGITLRYCHHAKIKVGDEISYLRRVNDQRPSTAKVLKIIGNDTYQLMNIQDPVTKKSVYIRPFQLIQINGGEKLDCL